MDADLAFFVGLSALINDRFVEDLRDEKQLRGPAPQKKPPKTFKEPKSTPAPVTLEAAPPEFESTPASDISDSGEPEEPPKERELQFSKIHVPTKVPTMMKKGKNKYQKLREALYRERVEADDQVAATWDKIKIAAAGGKVELTATQIKKSLKNERQQKRKKFEKKVEKEMKQKQREENEAKKKTGRIQKGKRFEKGSEKGKGAKKKRPDFKKH
jgi:hypothetical protein